MLRRPKRSKIEVVAAKEEEASDIRTALICICSIV
jgi:hypothetical protein